MTSAKVGYLMVTPPEYCIKRNQHQHALLFARCAFTCVIWARPIVKICMTLQVGEFECAHIPNLLPGHELCVGR